MKLRFVIEVDNVSEQPIEEIRSDLESGMSDMFDWIPFAPPEGEDYTKLISVDVV